MNKKLICGTKVAVDFGQGLTCTGSISGVSSELMPNVWMYIVTLDKRIPNWDYDVITVPQGCLTVSA